MNAEKLADQLDMMLGFEINEWERDDIAERLSVMERQVQKEALRQIPVIWPVSSGLYFAFVDQLGRAAACLDPSQFSVWVAATLDVYEAGGLRQAQLYMEKIEENFLCQLRGETGLKFTDIEGRLLPYARSLAGRHIELAPDREAWTDTNTVFLPEEITLFADNTHNFLLYKLTLSFQLALDLLGSFRLPGTDDKTTLTAFFSSFADHHFGQVLFHHLEACRILGYLHCQFPGLMRDCQPLFQEFLARQPVKGDQYSLQRLVLCHGLAVEDETCAWAGPQVAAPGSTVADTLRLTRQLYDGVLTENAPGLPNLPFMGILRPEEAAVGMARRRAKVKSEFIEALAMILAEHGIGSEADKERQDGIGGSREEDTAGALLTMPPDGQEEQSEPAAPEHQGFVTINSAEVELNDEASRLATEIQRDQGRIPQEYISAALGRAGGLAADLALEGEQEEGQEARGPVIYDEWDYRRSGFRKNWCQLNEKELDPIKGTFVESTLEKYKGQLISLRRQFEMMAVQERFERRQRDGTDIDLDAVIEAVSDSRAGLPMSERLFIRLQRNERNIAVLFLVDMSSSTEGWVSTALKESLILMCEALDILGDQYAIYGFSGMRRSRNDFFTVKSFAEPYDQSIKGKIAAIAPKEYTRMGPAIRHAATLLNQVEAKVRLLVTLSDGKPEDYDHYKGAYAIEDTRHALIEAKNSGIHPFCITVDREAHDYMAHMYGEVNYIFIDDVFKLPGRMPEIYRTLTT